MKKYRKKPNCTVVAVQLDFDTEGFEYNKWGGKQFCKPQDWIVSSDGETHTVDNEVFQKNYQELSRGIYLKTAPVWAEKAEQSGYVKTMEGASAYEAGDYLVYNNKDGSDGYCMSAEKFESTYELIE